MNTETSSTGQCLAPAHLAAASAVIARSGGVSLSSALGADEAVVLAFGMGLESTAYLVRILEEPELAGFQLEALVVLVAMTGNEWPEQRALVEEHVLPRCRARGVRVVQVARAGPREADGVVVLDDSREPTRLYLEGRWKLSDEMARAGTVPQFASGRRLCSVKFKGWPMDTWLAHYFGPRDEELAPATPGTILPRLTKRDLARRAKSARLPARRFRHLIGFNSEELFRVTRDRSYSTETRLSDYPLVTWGWTREACDAYLFELLGVHWPKSCCTFCPFSGGKEHCLARFREQPHTAAQALLLEYVSLALNPRVGLYAGRTLRALLELDGQAEALAHFQGAMETATWAVYHVRRYYKRKGLAYRAVASVSTGTRAACSTRLRELAAEHGAEVVLDKGHLRVWLRNRQKDVYPAAEELLVVAPAGVEDKARAGFEGWWSDFISGGQAPVDGAAPLAA